MQTLAHALTWAARSQDGAPVVREVAAFVILGLRQIAESVDQTATAWEKRDYWLKADRFRLEWLWVDHNLRRLDAALRAEDWSEVMAAFGDIAGQVSQVKIPQKMQPTRPWEGAFAVWKSQSG
jgi:hypothetical protein